LSEILEIRKRAHAYVQSGELDRALEEYRKLVGGDQIDPNIFNLMGDVHFKKGDKEEAFCRYAEAVHRYGEENLYSNAIAVCRKMLRLDPTHIDAHRLLGELYLEQGFTGEAIGYFLDFASALIERGELASAVDSLKKVIEAAPSKVKVRQQLAEVYLHLGLSDEARSELLVASEIYHDAGEDQLAAQLRTRADEVCDSSDEVEGDASIEGQGTDRVEIVHKRIGLAHHAPLKIGEVLRSFQDEVKKAIGDQDYQCHYDLGISYLDLGFFDEALAEFGVSRKHPDLRLKSIEMAGRCFVEKGDVELAIEELQSGLAIEGYSAAEHLGLRYNLALAYEQLGQTEQARRCYEEICEADDSYRDAREKLEQLGQRSGQVQG
jgi:tetratricopeptide (TPR) repeat protein